ncbi:5-hydroxytryptamine receptor 1A-alpha-like [Lytechinus variegatus]|uniref:5-hydroxytryptamine receptor 1A-alpha-like n=1 Tax=Lytechinus variegatus TaxID=7654 RepID=UPI001BB27A58|nr:5-hydroxytryptamine receptor 1A-alpha-like [Lytechinus variegatus]
MYNQSSNSAANVALESLSLFIIMPGSILASGMATFVILNTRSLRKHAHNLLILSLNIADLGVALFTMPCAMISVFDGGKYLTTNTNACKVNGFLAVLFTFAIPSLILTITLERFLVVNLSQRFPPNRRRVYIFIAISWGTSLIAAILPLTGWISSYSYIPTTRHCSPPWLDPVFYVAGISLLVVEIPLLLLLYAAIIYNLKKTGTKLKKTGLRDKPCKECSATGDDTTSPPPSVSRPLEDDPEVDSETVQEIPNATPSTEGTVLSSGEVESKTMGRRIRANLKTKGRRLFKQKSFGARKRQWSAQRRVATIGAVLVITTIICWIPYLLVHLDIIPLPDDHWFGVMTMWFAFTNVLLDPAIYTFMNRQARAELQRYFKNLKISCQLKPCRVQLQHCIRGED